MHEASQNIIFAQCLYNKFEQLHNLYLKQQDQHHNQRQLFLYAQLLFIAGKRQLRIVFPCNFQEQIAHIALKEFRI